jgi:hypothetical protein
MQWAELCIRPGVLFSPALLRRNAGTEMRRRGYQNTG